MSEIVDMGGIVRDGGWIALCAFFVVALAMLVLDFGWKAREARGSAASRESNAA